MVCPTVERRVGSRVASKRVPMRIKTCTGKSPPPLDVKGKPLIKSSPVSFPRTRQSPRQRRSTRRRNPPSSAASPPAGRRLAKPPRAAVCTPLPARPRGVGRGGPRGRREPVPTTAVLATAAALGEAGLADSRGWRHAAAPLQASSAWPSCTTPCGRPPCYRQRPAERPLCGIGAGYAPAAPPPVRGGHRTPTPRRLVRADRRWLVRGSARWALPPPVCAPHHPAVPQRRHRLPGRRQRRRQRRRGVGGDARHCGDADLVRRVGATPARPSSPTGSTCCCTSGPPRSAQTYDAAVGGHLLGWWPRRRGPAGWGEGWRGGRRGATTTTTSMTTQTLTAAQLRDRTD